MTIRLLVIPLIVFVSIVFAFGIVYTSPWCPETLGCEDCGQITVHSLVLPAGALLPLPNDLVKHLAKARPNLGQFIHRRSAKGKSKVGCVVFITVYKERGAHGEYDPFYRRRLHHVPGFWAYAFDPKEKPSIGFPEFKIL